MKRSILCLSTILLFFGCQTSPVPAEGQEAEVVAENLRPDPQKPTGENLTVPADWQVRLDQPNPEAVIGADADSSDIFFVSMVPGWHITTGPAGIYYHPHSTATGNYEATMEVYLFDPGERREAFGMIIGGNNLETADQTYDYFLIRNSGEFLIKRRTGEETSMLHEWTESEAIIRFSDPSASSVLNKLAVRAEDNDVAFVINGVEVARLARMDVQTEGMVGFRVNHALNLHVSNIEVEEGD